MNTLSKLALAASLTLLPLLVWADGPAITGGSACRVDEDCPNVGTQETPASGPTPSGEGETCGGSIVLTIPLPGGGSIETAPSSGPNCPNFYIYTPAQHLTVPKPGYCITDSQWKEKLKLNYECNCVSRFIFCLNWQCEQSGTQTLDVLPSFVEFVCPIVIPQE